MFVPLSIETGKWLCVGILLGAGACLGKWGMRRIAAKVIKEDLENPPIGESVELSPEARAVCGEIGKAVGKFADALKPKKELDEDAEAA